MLEMLRVIREQEPVEAETHEAGVRSNAALPTPSANRGTEPAKLTKLVRAASSTGS